MGTRQWMGPLLELTGVLLTGDSGLPVFSGTSNVTLLGILWGGSGSQFVYSPIANIEQELGALTTR
jgi:hypothetical protein